MLLAVNNTSLSKTNNIKFLQDCYEPSDFFLLLGGAQIIDMMMLVVDVVKGMQTQTAECLVIGEILCEKMVVVLNKVDLIPEPKRQATIEKVSHCCLQLF